MIALFLSPIYILLCLYILRWGIRWMSSCHHFFQRLCTRVLIIILYSIIALSILIGFLLPNCAVQRVFKTIGNYWLGTLLYIIQVTVIADLIRMILKRINFPHKEKLFSKRGFVVSGALCIGLIAALSLDGIYGASVIRTTDYQVAIHKTAGDLKELKIALVSDLHMGYNIGTKHIADMVEKINATDPDLVVIAGDIFDNEYEALDDPAKLAEILSGIKSRYGVYACYGNHDIEEKILAGFTFSSKKKKTSDPRMDQLLEDANINLLRDEGVLIDDSFYLYGRPDYRIPGRGISERKTPEELTASMDSSKPIIVIDHEPKELQELSDAGVDLDLSGHTHDGQMFPGNLTIKLMWENACGYLKKGNMHSIVTSGVGVFGPKMRVGTKNEVCNITVTFDK